MNSVHSDIWQFQAGLGRRLLRWAGFSTAAGLAMSLVRDRLWNGIGTQAISWGLIDGMIGWFGLHTARRQAGTPGSHQPLEQQRRTMALRHVLWINSGLDPLYMAGGIAIALTKGREDRFWRGTGWGIVAQGGFLLLFDLAHALLLSSEQREAR